MYHSILAATIALLTTSPPSARALPDVVVGAGETLLFDTSHGPVLVRSLTIETGGVVRVIGSQPLLFEARRSIVIHGLLDLSGFDAMDVATLNTGHIPEPGGPPGPGGGQGGVGSWITDNSTPHGGQGFGSFMTADQGGHGGESAYSSNMDQHTRRPGGGGGGVLAADQPVSGNPDDPANDGLVAEGGRNGHALSTGCGTDLSPAAGGAPATAVFVDGDPTNDFWGRKPVAGSGVLRGELAGPMAGRGGGAGGDALPSDRFPTANWTISSDEKGGAGGGGGGLSLIATRHFVLGPAGHVRADGGDGGRGENILFLDSIGGNGGGGSGGFLVIQALTIDLRTAGDNALTALGGLGATDLPNWSAGEGDGGNGGPGVIQLHTPGARNVLLPPGKELSDLSSPDAHSLLPFLPVH